MLLRCIDVGSDKYLIIFVRLQLLVDEALVVEAVAQHEGVGDRSLQELGGDVGQVGFVGKLKGNIMLSIFL